MGQRLSRAKARSRRRAYRSPCGTGRVASPPRCRPRRVVYLIFNAGYSAGPSAGRDLAEEAIWLWRLLTAAPWRFRDRRLPGPDAPDTRAQGRARRSNRRDGSPWPTGSAPVGPHGDHRGVSLVERALSRRRFGPYQIKAAIRRLQLRRVNFRLAADRRALRRVAPVRADGHRQLNHAVAIAESRRSRRRLRAVEMLAGDLSVYHPGTRPSGAAGTAGSTKEAKAAYCRLLRSRHLAAMSPFLPSDATHWRKAHAGKGK